MTSYLVCLHVLSTIIWYHFLSVWGCIGIVITRTSTELLPSKKALDYILFETAHAGMVFSGVCSGIKWGEKNKSKKQNIRRSQHRAKYKPISASICPCQRFYCSTLRGKQQTVVVIVYRSILHDPVAGPFDLFSTHQSQTFHLRIG